jgi:hypothetical protein
MPHQAKGSTAQPLKAGCLGQENGGHGDVTLIASLRFVGRSSKKRDFAGRLRSRTYAGCATTIVDWSPRGL